jgi:hypothetical protein
MKLNQALTIVKTRKPTGEPKLCFLACLRYLRLARAIRESSPRLSIRFTE